VNLRRRALLLAGAGSSCMAALHLFLPYRYGWGKYGELVPAAQAHIVLAISLAIGFFLLWAGCLSIFTALRRKTPGRLDSLILIGLAAFWALYVAYQKSVPPPFPSGVQTVLLVVGGVLAGLYLLFVLTRPAAEAHPAKDET